MSGALRLAAALVGGLLFGFGLALSGMMDPAKVLGFLDVTGAWDPSLAFVLGGAVAVSAGAYAIAGRLDKPLAGCHFAVPTATALDAKLVAGSALFGVGWGLTGLCPGPALAGLTLGRGPILMFTLAMLAGMLAHRLMAVVPPALPARKEPVR